MANLIQKILVRTDLGFSEGLMAAQVAHIHARPMTTTFFVTQPTGTTGPDDYVENVKTWLFNPYVFVHGVPNREVLNFFMEQCDRLNMKFDPWRDTIYVDVSPTQTKVFEDVLIGISIGPEESDKIKAIVGDLPLL